MHFPPIAFYAELYRPPEDDPDLPALEKKYGDHAVMEIVTLQQHLLGEVASAAAGLLYTLGKLEALLSELQAYVDEHVPRPEPDEPWPEFGSSVAHPLVVEASFEFVNFLSWLRAVDERLDRRRPDTEETRAGLLPALGGRPLRSKVEELMRVWRAEALERTLANYAMHAAMVPAPLGGASLSPEHRVSLRVPDRPQGTVKTRWHLTYEEERDALNVAREAARRTEALVDGLIEAFADETRAIEEERNVRRR
jgi:hypothetical protein